MIGAQTQIRQVIPWEVTRVSLTGGRQHLLAGTLDGVSHRSSGSAVKESWQMGNSKLRPGYPG